MFCVFKRRRKTRTQDHSAESLPSGQTEEITIDPEDDAPLCSTCSTLDLYDIILYNIPERHAISLGHLTAIFDRYDQCGLCRLVTNLIRRMWGLDESSSVNLTKITCSLYAIDHQLYIRTFGRRRNITSIMTATELRVESEIQLLDEDASKIGKTIELYSRRVAPTVNIGLLKRWIYTCESEHQEKCEAVWWRGPGDALLKRMKVVDVTRMSIVPAPPKCRYVTLSYVWGGAGGTYETTKANHRKRRMPGGLDASVLPATISDTIELVRQLGERYLWIDALCIVQDDRRDKEVQIGIMDLIYSNSVFTIFAVNNISAQDPLPGIRRGTRDYQQHVVKIQGLRLAVSFSPLSDVIASSVWNQRGWTYQEFMLSRRRIFVTVNQVHFECIEGNWCEGVVGGYDSSTGSFSIFDSSSWRNEAYLRDYAEIINTYTKRKLTKESDIINAIAALLKTLTRAYKLAEGNYDEAFRFGMPVVNLTEALLWQPAANASHSRRSVDGTGVQCPSWSWVGWRGAARYNSVSVFVDLKEHPDNNIFIYETLVQQWYIADDNGRPQAVRQGVRLHDGHTGEDMEDASLSMYVAPDGDINPQSLITNNTPLRPGTLVFRTSSTRFDVRRAHDVVGARAVADYAIYSILTDNPRPATLIGRVILPSSTSSPASHRFIVLARAGHCKGLYDESVLRKPYHGCMMYVMAVQETQYESIVERVGVGVIFEQAWLKSTAEQGIVFLG